jgi:pimeloyl-ACP methyl ester carboxylesterase
MHIELLPTAGQHLVRSTCRPDQKLVVGYWTELLERPVEDLAADMAQTMTVIRAARLPYVIVTGAEPEPDYRSWLADHLPTATITVWPQSSHFPHVAHPGAFAEVLAATSSWPDGTMGRAAAP